MTPMPFSWNTRFMMKFTRPPGLSTATRMFGSVIWSSELILSVIPTRCSVLSTWMGQNAFSFCPRLINWMTCVMPVEPASAPPETSTWAAAPSSSNSVRVLFGARPNLSPNSSGAWNCPTYACPVELVTSRTGFGPEDGASSSPHAAAMSATALASASNLTNRFTRIHLPIRRARPAAVVIGTAPSLLGSSRLPPKQAPLDDPGQAHRPGRDDRDEEHRTEQGAEVERPGGVPDDQAEVLGP